MQCCGPLKGFSKDQRLPYTGLQHMDSIMWQTLTQAITGLSADTNHRGNYLCTKPKTDPVTIQFSAYISYCEIFSAIFDINPKYCKILL